MDSAEKPNVFDLSDILSRPMAPASQPAMFELENNENITNAAEFEPEPEPNPAPIAQAQQAEQKAGMLKPEDLAIIIVNMADTAQKGAFTVAKRKLTFNPDEIEALQGLDTKSPAKYAADTKEGRLINKWVDYIKTLKTLPFSNEEKRVLTEATVIYIRTVDLQVTPFMGLLMAYGGVLGTRAYDVFIA
ncbi:MAG: hypothetical protein ACXVJE_19390 [Mucilaginibacter sp.]